MPDLIKAVAGAGLFAEPPVTEVAFVKPAKPKKEKKGEDEEAADEEEGD
jgi:hypothetical protein